MIDFIKSKVLILVALLFFSFYMSFIFTVGLQIFNVHSLLINEKSVVTIEFGVITFATFALVPIFLWKLVEDSQIPILKETLGARLLLSELAIVFTMCLFISKSIYNSVAKTIMSIENDALLDVNGKIVLIEILSVAIPVVLFLYISKRILYYFLKTVKE